MLQSVGGRVAGRRVPEREDPTVAKKRKVASRVARKPKAARPKAPARKASSGVSPSGAAPDAARRAAITRIETDRRALRLEAKKEVKARMDAYFQGAAPAGAGPALMAAGASRGLRVIAQGDSWFDYPLLLRGSIIPRVESLLEDELVQGAILNLAHHGDEVRMMLGVTKRQNLIRALQKVPFDALLFSGGGNDIVGDQFALWLQDRNSVSGPADALREEVFDAVLEVVRAGYQDLIAIRDQYAPNCVIFLHGYCIPFPQDEGACGLGPWLWPSLEFRGWTDPGEQREVARIMLGRFADMLKQIASGSPGNIVYIDTQMLEIPREEWDNEIHPDGDGFDSIARMFEGAIRGRFSL
jgi:hypothetical protein